MTADAIIARLRDPAATRPVARPRVGTMPEPRTHDGVWWSNGSGLDGAYTLQRGAVVLARIDVTGDLVTTQVAPARMCEAHRVSEDVARLVHWLSCGGR